MMQMIVRMTLPTWASNTFPVLMGLVRLQRTKPGDTSLSSIPFTLILTFSPLVTAVTSISSDQICSTFTSVLVMMDYHMFVKYLINVTLLGITRRGSPFLQAPLSTFPITIVPMSLYLEEKNILLWINRKNIWDLLIYDWHHEGTVHLSLQRRHFINVLNEWDTTETWVNVNIMIDKGLQWIKRSQDDNALRIIVIIVCQCSSL